MARCTYLQIELTTNFITQVNMTFVIPHIIHVVMDITNLHCCYLAPVGDNYAPSVSQVFMDAHLDKEYLHLPRMKLRIENKGAREAPSAYMSLLDFLFAAGTRSARQVMDNLRTCCASRGHHIYICSYLF